MKRVIWKRFLFVVAASLLLTGGIGVDVVAQGRGSTNGRGAGASGGVRPHDPRGPGGPILTRGEVIRVPATHRVSVIDDRPMPTRGTLRIPDVERMRRDEYERSRREERERRDERRRQEDEAQRAETRHRHATRHHDEEANRFQKLARWLEVPPERLQNSFLEAKAVNPNLRLGQFFEAFVIANRLNSSHPSVTPQAILRGLDSGWDLERTLASLGLNGEEVKATVKWAHRVVNHLKP